MTDDRRPPYDEAAEAGIIGSIFLKPDIVPDMCDEQGLATDAFYVPAHRVIYDCIGQLRSSGKVVDLIAIESALADSGKIDTIGGRPTLYRFMDTPHAGNAEHYVKIVLQKHARRKIIEVARATEAQAYDPESEIEQMIADAETALFDILKVPDTPSTNMQAVNAAIKEWSDAANGNIRGLPCFIPRLAQIIGQYRRGKMYVVGGTPGGGKTTFGTNQMKFWAEHDIPAACASIEMEHSEIIGNILGEMANMSVFELDRAIGSPETKKQRVKQIDEHGAKVFKDSLINKNLHINDRNLTVDQLCVWTRMMVRKHGIKALVVDYLQILDAGIAQGKSGGRRSEIDYCLKRLVSLAKELDIVVLLLSQFTKAARTVIRTKDGPQEAKPTAADLKESGKIQEDAFCIILLYMLENRFYADVVKHRRGPTGQVELQLQGTRQRICDVRAPVQD